MWNLFTVNNKDTDVVQVALLLTLNRFYTSSSISIVDFEQANVYWIGKHLLKGYKEEWYIFVLIVMISLFKVQLSKHHILSLGFILFLLFAALNRFTVAFNVLFWCFFHNFSLVFTYGLFQPFHATVSFCTSWKQEVFVLSGQILF